MRFALLIFVVAILPTPALAYVDPGVLAVVYQLAYAFIFGAFTLFILRPWNYVRGLFRRSSKIDSNASSGKK